MVIRVWSFEFRVNVIPNFDISQSTAEVITMPTVEATLLKQRYQEGITKARRCDFQLGYLQEGLTMATQRRVINTMHSR